MLQVEALTAHYGQIQAIHDVNLRVDAGEIVTIVGSNGAGKSTTLMAISGALRATRGTVTFEAKPLQGCSSAQIARRGLVQVPEGRRIFGEMTVSENLDLGAFTRSKSERAETQEQILGYFPRLKERMGQLGGTLSGGEQQMLAIGRALMVRPKLLILDEPSLGLAPKVIDQIFEIIDRLNKAGMTILLVEQNAVLALEIAHRGYVLETGSVTLDGRAQDLLHDPKVRSSYLGL